MGVSTILPEDHLPEWDGRFSKGYDIDTLENGGVYSFSSNSEIDEYFDMAMLGVSIDVVKTDEDADKKDKTDDASDKNDDEDADSDYAEFLQLIKKGKKKNM